jgi:hypothetical protein
MTTIPVASCALTRLPLSTSLMPVLPLIGALIVAHCRFALALSIKAWSSLTWASF